MMRTTFVALVAIALLGVVSPAQADSLTVTFTTTPAGGPYAPRNIVAVWIEGPGGTFVKTIGRWANVRRSHLVAWQTKAGTADVDAVSGATRASHTGALTATWDLHDKAGAVVPDGTYTIRMELADSNASTPTPNHQGTFTFVKNGQSSSTTGGTNGGFEGVAIDYVAVNAATCGNGALDPGEACDGNCPTTCTPSVDACAPVALVGSAADCSATCATTAITACADGDGCCPAGCDSTMDMDCAPTGGGGGGGGGGSDTVDQNITGGCAASGGGSSALAGFVLIGLGFARRRRVP
ncbi:MAG: DUF2271 domain-containing protein [Deltaproteobacteria bacterium]|nr:DUF2271 domain-containing protein [Deltaproteobacteria bacterium]